jgi:hypothetical protein
VSVDQSAQAHSQHETVVSLDKLGERIGIMVCSKPC